MSTPCDLIADNAKRVMTELDKMVSRVQRAQNAVNNILNSASDLVGQTTDILPDTSSLPAVSDINNMLANIDNACPQLDLDNITGFISEMQESYQGLIRSAKRDPLQSLKSLQDNLRDQFQSQDINDKLSRLSNWLQCVEAICGSLDGFAPGKGNTASDISNYYNNNLSINNEGQPQILSDSIQSQVSSFEQRVSDISDYADGLSFIGV